MMEDAWIRIGPRRARASVDEEKILIERRASYAKTYDLAPALGSRISDISTEAFKLIYLPLAIDEETLLQIGRNDAEQLASLRFFDLRENCPTNGGILLFGLNPLFYLPGAYIQYIKFAGKDVISDVEYEKQFSGPYVTGLKALVDFITFNIVKERPVTVFRSI